MKLKILAVMNLINVDFLNHLEELRSSGAMSLYLASNPSECNALIVAECSNSGSRIADVTVSIFFPRPTHASYL